MLIYYVSDTEMTTKFGPPYFFYKIQILKVRCYKVDKLIFLIRMKVEDGGCDS